MTNTPHNPSKSLREPQATYTLLLPVLTLQSFFGIPKFLQFRKILVQHEHFGHTHYRRVHIGTACARHRVYTRHVYTPIFSSFITHFFGKFLVIS